MSFDVAAEAYDRFMGRYSGPLARPFATFAGVASGQRVLDVGCGPGALTAELVARTGADRVSAADPSEPFVEAARARFPTIDVRRAAAEALPFEDATFDAALAQLVVHFMSDPIAGVREMARVTTPGGTVAACVWDFAGDRGPISPFWRAARQIDPAATGEADLAGARRDHLTELFRSAGLRDVEETRVEIAVDHPTFDDWWAPFTLGVGPAGVYARDRSVEELEAIRERAQALLPEPPFTIVATAWAARARP